MTGTSDAGLLMRVALVLQKLVGLRGGAERVVIDLAHELGRREHYVTIVTYDPTTGLPGYAADDLTIVDIFPGSFRTALSLRSGRDRLESVERSASKRGNRRPLADMKWQATHGLFARKLASWLQTNPQDAVVGFLPPAISAVSVAGAHMKGDRPRLIASTHNVPSEDFGPSPRWDQNPVARRRNLWALETADAVTVLQDDFIDELPALARDHAVVVPNAVARLAPCLGVERDRTIIGVGRLTDVKRFDVLVNAFARIAPEASGWAVSIHGDGPESARLAELIDRLGLSDRIRLAGATVDMASVYDHARILCHPARFEGFGLSVAEAIMHGLDVVASVHCPGVNRLVEDNESGVLVDDTDDEISAFARGLRRLIDRPLPVGRRQDAADRLAERLSPQRVYDQWEKLLLSS